MGMEIKLTAEERALALKERQRRDGVRRMIEESVGEYIKLVYALSEVCSVGVFAGDGCQGVRVRAYRLSDALAERLAKLQGVLDELSDRYELFFQTDFRLLDRA